MAGQRAHHAAACEQAWRAHRGRSRSPARRRDLPPTRARSDAPAARRSRATRTQTRCVTQAGDHGRLRALLPRRHRRGVRRSCTGGGGSHHPRRPLTLAGEDRGLTQRHLPRRRGAQARHLGARPGDAAGAQYPRAVRPEVDGLQLGAVPAHALPGHEPVVRRPGFLLRRSRVPARGTDLRPALQRLRQSARRAHRRAQ